MYNKHTSSYYIEILIINLLLLKNNHYKINSCDTQQQVVQKESLNVVESLLKHTLEF